MHGDESSISKRVTGLLHQWKQALLFNSVNLEALMICSFTVPCPPMLRCLPKLKFPELTLWDSKALLGQFCVDLSFCSCLESLKITLEKAGECEIHCSKLPELQLTSLSKLKRVELMGWFPETDIGLPLDCELFVSVAFDETFP